MLSKGRKVISKETRLKLIELLTGRQTSNAPIPIDKNLSLTLTKDGLISTIHVASENLDETYDNQNTNSLINFIDSRLIESIEELSNKLDGWRNLALQEINQ